MIKNILIIILLSLLVSVWLWITKPNQIADLWKKTKEFIINIWTKNLEWINNQTDLKTLGLENLSILKNYTGDSIEILLQTDEWQEKIKEEYLNAILEKYNLKSYSDLKENITVLQEYLNWIKQIETLNK